MAKARKCDRCGKFYEQYKGNEVSKNEKANGLFLVDKDWNEEYYRRKVYDLCPDCMRKLESFSKGSNCQADSGTPFTIVFNPGEVSGTMEIGGKTLQVYLADAVDYIHCSSDESMTKRKFTVVEM